MKIKCPGCGREVEPMFYPGEGWSTPWHYKNVKNSMEGNCPWADKVLPEDVQDLLGKEDDLVHE